MTKLHIKKGDTVYVNSGEDKGKTGRVLEVLVKKNRAVVEGVTPRIQMGGLRKEKHPCISLTLIR